MGAGAVEGWAQEGLVGIAMRSGDGDGIARCGFFAWAFEVLVELGKEQARLMNCAVEETSSNSSLAFDSLLFEIKHVSSEQPLL